MLKLLSNTKCVCYNLDQLEFQSKQNQNNTEMKFNLFKSQQLLQAMISFQNFHLFGFDSGVDPTENDVKFDQIQTNSLKYFKNC